MASGIEAIGNADGNPIRRPTIIAPIGPEPATPKIQNTDLRSITSGGTNGTVRPNALVAKPSPPKTAADASWREVNNGAFFVLKVIAALYQLD